MKIKEVFNKLFYFFQFHIQIHVIDIDIVLILFRKNNIAPRMRTKNKNLCDIIWNSGLSHYTKEDGVNIFT